MRFNAATLLLFGAATALAQSSSSSGSVDGISSCAIPCLESAINASGCGLDDTQCQCTSGRSTIIGQVTPCLESKSGCSITDLQGIPNELQSLCSDATSPNGTHTNISLPTDVPNPSSSSSSAAAGSLRVGTSGAALGLLGCLAFALA